MTALGRDGEYAQVQRFIDANPTGIISCVADSYNIYDFVDAVGGRFKNAILGREGKFVVRPDSVTQEHPQPGALMVALFEKLWTNFGGTTNEKGFKVLHPNIGLIWGDGIDPEGIEKILNRAQVAGIAAENFVFGMGGGLLQKLNRDTERFAFKSSAQRRDGVWHDVFKNPVGGKKPSKAGRLALVPDPEDICSFVTVRENEFSREYDVLETVFLNGEVLRMEDFEDIRDRAAL